MTSEVKQGSPAIINSGENLFFWKGAPNSLPSGVVSVHNTQILIAFIFLEQREANENFL